MMSVYGERRVAMVDDVSVAVMAVSASPIDDDECVRRERVQMM